MRKREIIFRADGNSTIGMGHFVRTLALAEMLKDDFSCTFAIQSPSNHQIDEISKVCNRRIDLPSNEKHFDVFLHYLKGEEIIVLDNYYYTTNYQSEIKSKGCKLVCIDDTHDKHFVSDLIINQAEGIRKSQYSTELYTKFCLGFKFALLRKDYLNFESKVFPKIYSCLIMLGGADPFNLTAKLFNLVEQLKFALPIAIVIGAENYNKIIIRTSENIQLFKSLESSRLYQLMKSAQFGMFPASTVAIEACAARLPFICGYYIDNQKAIYKGIENNNLAICVGNLFEINSNIIGKAVKMINQEETIKKIKRKQTQLLDKNSKDRYITVFKQLWE
jgi:UDP-2,4-diacetamido-2,4,6-trideoxy-beta-L-altropyranose hydrolase